MYLAKNREETEKGLIQELSVTFEGRLEVVKRFGRQRYLELSEHPDDRIIELYGIIHAPFETFQNDCYTDEFDAEDFSVERQEQLKTQIKGSNNPWQKKIAEMATAGEICTENWVTKSGISHTSISTKNPFSGVDHIINKRNFDTKTKIKIGSKMCSDLAFHRWDKSEKLILVHAGCRSLDDPTIRCRLVGVFDHELLIEHGLGDMLKGFSYFSPPFFFDPEAYFKKDNV